MKVCSSSAYSFQHRTSSFVAPPDTIHNIVFAAPPPLLPAPPPSLATPAAWHRSPARAHPWPQPPLAARLGSGLVSQHRRLALQHKRPGSQQLAASPTRVASPASEPRGSLLHQRLGSRKSLQHRVSRLAAPAYGPRGSQQLAAAPPPFAAPVYGPLAAPLFPLQQ